MIYFIAKASNPIYKKPKPTDKAFKINNEWHIKINKLKDLKKLIEQEGEIIMNKNSILIYDDYIE